VTGTVPTEMTAGDDVDGGDEKVWKPSEIIARYGDGARDFRRLEIADPRPWVEVGNRFESASEPASFGGAVLDGADFSGAFVCADFRGASLRDCRFVAANVKTCAFDGADLRGCDFTDAAIDAATFDGARMDGATFAGAGAFGHTLKPGELPR
jgi:hypothetical protein